MTNVNWRNRVTLGRTGLKTSRIGLASSYGLGAGEVEQAYADYGINYLYWGTYRRAGFGEGIRRLARRRRDDLIIVIQSYSRFAGLLAWSLERALRRLQLDHADLLLLGYHSQPPSKHIMDAALRLRDQGKARFLGVSCHRRATFRRYIQEGMFDVLMFRYNAAHRGADAEILPHLNIPDRPGTVSYTSTRWGQLLKPGKIPHGEKVPRAGDCYRFALSQPHIDMCLAGPADAAQMREGLSALDTGPMSAEEIAWMRRIGEHVHGRK
jgi:aryl-alcohol dehydrogenase-like predicted oxidoreductase